MSPPLTYLPELGTLNGKWIAVSVGFDNVTPFGEDSGLARVKRNVWEEPVCARSSTWVHSSPVDSIRCYQSFTNGYWRQGSLGSWR